MATTDELRAAIDRYIATFSSGDAAAWAACFAEDATQEDPVGAPVNTGRAAIQSFHENTSATFGALRLVLKDEPVIIGHEAAMSLYAQAGEGENRMRMPNIIDALTFNEDGSIASLRAFWTMDSITPDPA
ncbi:MAG: nuclear transport factor 2 family protein [Acidimicrobiales bacterium]